MKFLFENESFSFETLRTAGFAHDGGSGLGAMARFQQTTLDWLGITLSTD